MQYMRIFSYISIPIYIKADLLHCYLKTGVYFCFNMQTSFMYCWDHIPSCQVTIITRSFTGACPDFQSNLPILNVGCVKQSISQLWVKDDVVSYRASGITTTTKLPAAIWLHLETQTCNTNSNCWSDWVGEALQTREHCCILACAVQTQSEWRDVTGKRFLFKPDNIQVSFALSLKKQEILATLMPKDKVLKETSCRDRGFWEPQELFL